MNKIRRKGDREEERKGKPKFSHTQRITWPYPNENPAMPKRTPNEKKLSCPKVKKHIMSESEGTAKRLKRLLRD